MSTSETPLTALELRQQEVAQYQANIDMYKTILVSMPTELPEHLEKFRTRTDKHVAIAEVEDLDDVELLSNVWFGEQLKASIRTEMVEQAKAKAILAAMQAQ
jgi:hypothetical protein